MKTPNPLILIFAVALELGCKIATAKVESVVDKSISLKITNVQIITDANSSQPFKQVTEDYSSALSNKFKENGVVNEFQITQLNKSQVLSLDPKQDGAISPLVEIINKSDKPYFLVSTMTHVRTSNGWPAYIEMEAFIYSKNHNKIIWKSNIVTGEGTIGVGFKALLVDEVVNKLFEKIKMDGLV